MEQIKEAQGLTKGSQAAKVLQKVFMQDKSLREALSEVLAKEKISAHMPGHKGVALHGLDWFSLDTTEIEGTDNLHAPTGILKGAMLDCARIYGASQSHYLVNGSTVGILAAIMGSSKPGDTIIVGRDCHKSVYSAVALHHLNELVIMPEVGASGEMLGYDQDKILEVLGENPRVKVVVITSPTYFGFCTPVSKLVACLEARQGTLIIDEAHGAHMEFTPFRQLSGLRQGAHIVIQSAHKTLPALTQTGLLHFGDKASDALKYSVGHYLSLLQTTSPSYIFMCSIDDALRWMVDQGEAKLEAIHAHLQRLRETKLRTWVSPIIPQDPFKLWLVTEPMGYEGYEIHEWLVRMGIQPELSNSQGVLLYLTALNTLEELDHIAGVLQDLPSREALVSSQKWSQMPPPERGMSRMAMEGLGLQDIEWVPLEAAIGRISAERLVPYPPGVPLVLPGEIFSKGHVDYLKGLSEKHVVLGWGDNRDLLSCVKASF